MKRLMVIVTLLALALMAGTALAQDGAASSGTGGMVTGLLHTHALVRCFKAFSKRDIHIDANADNKLDALELFKFAEKEVPQLVEKKRPKANTPQRPNLFWAEPGKAMVLFE